MNSAPRICNYEGSDYRADFWAGRGREYEDLAERIALRHLLPAAGHRLLDLGAGFGRLSEFYQGYEEVVMLDYSRSLLRQARERLERAGREGRIKYVAASFYDMPLASGAFEAAMMVRVMHHVADVPALLSQVGRILAANGTFVVEFASKRHLKAIARYLLRRQRWSPFDRSPYEFAEMNIDFHPDWMEDRLGDAGFHVKHRRTVSHFRLPFLKRLLPAPLLAAADGLCQPTGQWWQLTPSVFLQCILAKGRSSRPAEGLFRCPACGATGMTESAERIACEACGRRWSIEDGIYDFKAAPSV